jgi:hypothetical protein
LFATDGTGVVAAVTWTLLAEAHGSVLAHTATVDKLRAWTPTVSASPAVMANQVVDSQAGMSSLPWRFVGLSSDGRSIELIYATGDGKCTTPFGIDIQETIKSVEIWALSTAVKTQTPCPQTAQYGRAIITLNDALGVGTLLHAAVDTAWVGPGHALNR